MPEELEDGRFIQRLQAVEGPQGGDSRVLRVGGDLLLERGQHLEGLPPGQQVERGLAEPAVGVLEQGDQLSGRLPGEIEGRERRTAPALEAIHAAAVAIDATLVVAGVIDALLVEIDDVEGTIGALLEIDRAEPGVAGGDGMIDVAGLERRFVRAEFTPHHVPLQRANAKQLPVVLGGQAVGLRGVGAGPLVDHELVGEAGDVVVQHLLEEAERIRVRQ